jgi:predicted RNA binding protein YcfA (HicA-like mRNA interferase family)
MLFASLPIKTKEIRKLVDALETAGLKVSVTSGKHHIKVVNPDTRKVVFFGPQSLGDRRAGKNIVRDLKKVGFNKNIKL